LRAAKTVVWDLNLETGEAVRSGSSLDILGIPSGSGQDFARLVHPEDRSLVDAALAAAYAGSGIYDVEFRVIRPDGGLRWVHEVAEVHRDEQGRPSHLCGVSVDITARKQTEAEREQLLAQVIAERERHGLIADAMPALISYVDAEQKYQFLNSTYEEWFGRPRAELLGRQLRDVQGEAAYAVLRPHVEAALAGRQTSFETEFPYRQRGTRYLHVTYIPHIGAGGDVKGFYVLGIDLTERKAAEDRQALLQAELDHRVRNILASVQSMVQLTARSAGSQDEYVSALHGRIGAMARAHGLLTRQQLAGVSLEVLLREALAAYSGAILTEGPAGCVLRAKDGLNLALGLHELATNAVKYGALSVPAGRVHISWSVTGEAPAERLRFLWQERGGPPVRPPERSGFGSKLLKSVLGRVHLTFAPHGVRCEIELKLAGQQGMRADPSARTGRAANHEEPGRPLIGRRLLVAEDEPLVALALQSMLEEAGADVVGPAKSLQEAEALKGEDVAAAVIDINLGGQMSYGLAQALLERGVPVLFATGYERVAIPERLQGIPVLQKPIDGPLLVRRLAEFVEGRG
jgi:PAS domain S-box-containing protein